MVITKKIVIQLMLSLELIVWSAWYYYGQKGIASIHAMSNNNAVYEARVKELQAIIASYEYEIKQWNKSTFYKEKIAREQLQMARRNDMIVYLTDAIQDKYSKSIK